jgi:hypothetical protein
MNIKKIKMSELKLGDYIYFKEEDLIYFFKVEEISYDKIIVVNASIIGNKFMANYTPKSFPAPDNNRLNNLTKTAFSVNICKS